MSVDALSSRTPLDYDAINVAGDTVTDSAYRCVRLDTCCASPAKQSITSHDIFICDNCGGIDVQGKHYSKTGWQFRSEFVRKRRESAADGPASHAVSGNNLKEESHEAHAK
jgi:hypothetical protein